MHSCETALCKTLNDIYLATDSGKCTMFVSLDLSAAFDTIDHNILLNRLHTRYGITGSPLAWLTLYLLGRTQSVCVGNASSTVTDCRTGVPVRLRNDLYCVEWGVKLYSLTHRRTSGIRSVTATVCRWHPVVHRLLCKWCYLTSVHSWVLPSLLTLLVLSQWSIALNPSKSEAIIFGTRQRLNSFQRPSGIHIVVSPVSISDHITTLGVTLDSNLTLNIHVSYVCKTAYYFIKALRHIKPVLTCDMARAVAASLIQTRLDFANSVLIGTSSSNIYKLQRVQNCLAKVVLQDFSNSVNCLLSQLHGLPVSKRIQFKIATLTYQLVTFGQPTYLSSVSIPYQPQRSLRSVSQNLLSIPRCNSSFGQWSFSYCAPKIWNELPLSVSQSPLLHTFKRSLKTHYSADNWPPSDCLQRLWFGIADIYCAL